MNDASLRCPVSGGVWRRRAESAALRRWSIVSVLEQGFVGSPLPPPRPPHHAIVVNCSFRHRLSSSSDPSDTLDVVSAGPSTS